MFNLGWGEWVVIFFLVLLLFGPKRLPEIARGLGRSIRQFQDGVRGLKENIEKEKPDDHDKTPRNQTPTP